MVNDRKRPQYQETPRLLIEAAVTLANGREQADGFSSEWAPCFTKIKVKLVYQNRIRQYLESLDHYSNNELSSAKNQEKYGKIININKAISTLIEVNLLTIKGDGEESLKTSGPAKKGGLNFILINLPSMELDDCLEEYECRLLAKESGEDLDGEDIENDKREKTESGITLNFQDISRKRTARFTGREEEIRRIHDELTSIPESLSLGIVGMGGIGKTELCLEYARKFKAEYPGGICFIKGNNDDSLTSTPAEQILSFGRMIGYRVDRDLTNEEQLKTLINQWHSHQTLLIFDDVLPSQIPAELQDARFKRLITSRDRVLDDSVQTIELEGLKMQESLDLLRKLLGGNERINQELDKAEALIDFCEYHPLGIELIGGYLRTELNQHIELHALYKELDDKRQNWSVIYSETFNPTSPLRKKQRSLYECFDLSWQQLDEAGKKIAPVVAMFNHRSVPQAILTGTLDKVANRLKDDSYSQKNYKRIIPFMVRYSLIKFIVQRISYRYHLLLRDFIGSQLPKNERSQWPWNSQQGR